MWEAENKSLLLEYCQTFPSLVCYLFLREFSLVWQCLFLQFELFHVRGRFLSYIHGVCMYVYIYIYITILCCLFLISYEYIGIISLYILRLTSLVRSDTISVKFCHICDFAQ